VATADGAEEGEAEEAAAEEAAAEEGKAEDGEAEEAEAELDGAAEAFSALPHPDARTTSIAARAAGTAYLMVVCPFRSEARRIGFDVAQPALVPQEKRRPGKKLPGRR
jgi:hypothetical protein